jgi:hypothetical protein
LIGSSPWCVLVETEFFRPGHLDWLLVPSIVRGAWLRDGCSLHPVRIAKVNREVLM